MASASRPSRTIIPVRRYGFDEESGSDLDVSSESDISGIHETSSASSSDSEEDLSNNFTSEWNFVTADNDRRMHDVPIFSKDVGLQVEAPERPEDFVFLILDEEVFQSIANWTNSRASRREYSSQTRSGNRKHSVGWNDITASDAKKLFAMLLVMGCVRKPHVRQYFSTNQFIETPFFTRPESFSRDKFSLIFSNLRFADYTNSDPTRMNKVLPVIDLLRRKVQQVYKIGPRASIDEFLLLHKGRLFMKQYIPKKRARFGMKGFSLNDSETAYTFDIEMYAGREESQQWTSGIQTENLSSSEKIVVHLLHRSDLLGVGLQLTIDNWFNSIRLNEFLLDHNTLSLGTIRVNRGVPSELVNHPMTPISSKFARKNDVLLVKFADKRTVYLCSSLHTADVVTRRRNVRSSDIEYQLPSMIRDYNSWMSGTDRIDQVMAPVKCTRKSFIWPKKLGLFLLQRLGVVNGFILAKQFMPDRMRRIRFADYQLMVVERLMAVTARPRLRHISQHRLEEIPPTATRPRPSLRCKQCQKQDGVAARQTRYWCTGCPKNTPLHRAPLSCFDDWHK